MYGAKRALACTIYSIMWSELQPKMNQKHKSYPKYIEQATKEPKVIKIDQKSNNSKVYRRKEIKLGYMNLQRSIGNRKGWILQVLSSKDQYFMFSLPKNTKLQKKWNRSRSWGLNPNPTLRDSHRDTLCVDPWKIHVMIPYVLLSEKPDRARSNSA